MDKALEMFTKAYETICRIVLSMIEMIKNMVSSITNPTEPQE